jgi:hypothetical protein
VSTPTTELFAAADAACPRLLLTTIVHLMVINMFLVMLWALLQGLLLRTWTSS